MQWRLLLLPFSHIFGLAAQARYLLFKNEILKRVTPKNVKAIVIGNLRVGGTGKTPTVILLAQELVNKNKNVAILSRGYGRKTHGFIEVKYDSVALDVGDEPLMIKRIMPKVPVFVCEDRVVGIEKIKALYNNIEFILLDDAFQHFKLKAHYYILLTEWSNPFYIDYPLPAGMLREYRIAAKRANYIITTKCPNDINREDQKKHINAISKYSNALHAFSSIRYLTPINLKSKIKYENIESELILITGIANAEPLKNYLNKYYKTKINHFEFKDHQEFSTAFIQSIEKDYPDVNKLITEKDYVRISNLNILDKPEKWFFIPIQYRIEHLDKLVENILAL
jgi:tetraacyldisaccharide 4'-kinase